MIPLVLLGAGLLLGAGVAIYWKKLAAWIKRIWERLPYSVKQNLQGATTFVKKIYGTFTDVINYYSYDREAKSWSETTVTKEVNENDVPAHIRAKLQGSAESVETTDEVEEKLKLSH